MDTPDKNPPLNYAHLLLVGISGAIILLVSVVLALVTTIPAIWPQTGLQIGSSVMLFAFLFLVERRYVTIQVKAQTGSVLARTEAMVRQTEETLRSLDARIDAAFSERDINDKTRADSFAEAGDYLSLRSLLQRAYDVGAISRHGVRTRIPRTPLLLRVHLPTTSDLEARPSADTDAVLWCVVEHRDRHSNR